MSCCELSVKGVLAESVTALIKSRFDHVITRPAVGPSTTLIIQGIDPAAERALLNLLWDTGHDVIAMRSSR